jgi:hypothetical protein
MQRTTGKAAEQRAGARLDPGSISTEGVRNIRSSFILQSNLHVHVIILLRLGQFMLVCCCMFLINLNLFFRIERTT